MSVDSNFNFLCGRPHGAGPPPPVHMRPPDPDPVLPPPCGRHKWMAPNDDSVLNVIRKPVQLVFKSARVIGPKDGLRKLTAGFQLLA